MSRVIINRYLFRELLGPILLCLLVFTLVLMGGRLVQLADLVINRGVSFGDLLLLLFTILPPLLVIIVPLSFLMGIMLGFGRLSADSETIALKANGVGLLDMAHPVFLIAVTCAAITMTISFWAAPWGKRAFRTTLYDITRKQVSIGLQPQVFMKKFSNLVLYANSLDERSGAMNGIFIVQQEPENPMLIVAESGLVQSDPLQQAVTLQLHNGVIHRQKTGSREDRYQVIGFTTYEISPDLSKSLAGAARPQRLKTNQMAVDELWVMAGAGADLNWVARGELHSRLCAPLAPLIFALFALPFSIFSQRSGRSGGFVVGLMIYAVYYFFTSLAETLTVEGHITPLLTFWIPHLLLVIAGGYLLRQGALERPAPLMAWIDRGMFRIRQFRERHADH